MTSKPFKSRLWHKWAGLLSALFLINLGVTGFILDHREWGWLYQDAFSSRYFNDAFVDDTRKHAMDTFKCTDSSRPKHRLQGGNRGLWRSEDGGTTWNEALFAGRSTMPMVTSVATDRNGTFSTLYAATNEGVWRSRDGGKTFAPFALEEKFVTALSYDPATGGVIGVVDRTEPFRLEKEGKIHPLAFAIPAADTLPGTVTLARFVYDLHFARGVFAGFGSWLWSDISGIALLLLSVSGIAFWLLPRFYSRRADRGRPVGVRTRNGIYRWMWRMHAPIAGVLAAVPILYLSATGILIDHSKELRGWMKSIDLPRDYLPPVYRFTSFEGEIYAIASYPRSPMQLSIGTRYGLFDSADGGQNWTLNPSVHTFVRSITREGETLKIKGMGGSDYTCCYGEEWLEKEKKGMGMSGFCGCDGPVLASVSWFDVIDGLHSGTIIAPWWKWANDLFAAAAIILVFTGILRWLRKRWI